MIPVYVVPFGKTNYLYAFGERDCILVDPGDADRAFDWMRRRAQHVHAIFLTHHHPDHIGGVDAIQKQTGCRVFGYGSDAHRLPILTDSVQEGDKFTLLGHEWEILDLSGHTNGHIGYFSSTGQVVAVGDTLFGLGCGRLFEGTASQMWHTLEKIMALPGDTAVFCAHEYTVDNAIFVENLGIPLDEHTISYIKQARATHAVGHPTVPLRISTEMSTNPFLRVRDEEYRRLLGLGHLSAPQAFGILRQWKTDNLIPPLSERTLLNYAL